MEKETKPYIQEMPVIQDQQKHECDEETNIDQPMPTLQPVLQIYPDQIHTEPTSELLPTNPTHPEQTKLEPSRISEEAETIPIHVEYQETEDTTSPPIICWACHLAIKERYLLQALDHYWHEDCLKCSCCDCRLGEVGSSLYTKANLLLCKRDYLRLFGASGACTICKKSIPAFEMVMKVKTNVYHLECFACQQCRQRFCVGDKFYLCENRILCEYDFEEQNLITSIQRGYNTLSHMRRQTETLSDISSGYGSPSPGTM